MIAHQQSALKGCSIAFDHDSPKIVREILKTESIISDIVINFVGPQGQVSHTHHALFAMAVLLTLCNDFSDVSTLDLQWDSLMRKALNSNCTHLRARHHVIYNWLTVLTKINCQYEDEPALPPYSEFQRVISESMRKLISQSLKSANDVINEETEVRRDDVAQIRGASSLSDPGPSPHGIEAEQNDVSSQSAGEETEGEMEMRYLYVTSTSKTANSSQIDQEHDFLCNAAKTLNINVKKLKEEYEESRRANDPLSEWGLDGERAIAGAHPDVFLFGRAFAPGKTNIARAHMNHLLLQFTNNAATCRSLVFYLFDRMQRHTTMQQLSAKIKQNPDSFKHFTEKFLSPQFKKKMEHAVSNPESKEAKSVLKDLLPVLTGGGVGPLSGQ